MLKIKQSIFDTMIRHLQSQYPLEACGFLSGTGVLADRIYCIDNVLQSPVAYEMDPAQQIEAMIEMDKRNESMLVIFHSHPQGPQHPSPTDIQNAFYPEALHLIVSLATKAQPAVNLFRIENGRFHQMAWSLV